MHTGNYENDAMLKKENVKEEDMKKEILNREHVKQEAAKENYLHAHSETKAEQESLSVVQVYKKSTRNQSFETPEPNTGAAGDGAKIEV